jgi:hypothetical protein
MENEKKLLEIIIHTDISFLCLKKENLSHIQSNFENVIFAYPVCYDSFTLDRFCPLPVYTSLLSIVSLYLNAHLKGRKM